MADRLPSGHRREFAAQQAVVRGAGLLTATDRRLKEVRYSQVHAPRSDLWPGRPVPETRTKANDGFGRYVYFSAASMTRNSSLAASRVASSVESVNRLAAGPSGSARPPNWAAALSAATRQAGSRSMTGRNSATALAVSTSFGTRPRSGSAAGRALGDAVNGPAAGADDLGTHRANRGQECRSLRVRKVLYRL